MFLHLVLFSAAASESGCVGVRQGERCGRDERSVNGSPCGALPTHLAAVCREQPTRLGRCDRSRREHQLDQVASLTSRSLGGLVDVSSSADRQQRLWNYS